jgi:hypothetical protein
VFYPVSGLPTGTKPLARRTLRVDHPPRRSWYPGFFYAAWEVPAFTFGPEQRAKAPHSNSTAGRVSRARQRLGVACSSDRLGSTAGTSHRTFPETFSIEPSDHRELATVSACRRAS